MSNVHALRNVKPKGRVIVEVKFKVNVKVKVKIKGNFDLEACHSLDSSTLHTPNLRMKMHVTTSQTVLRVWVLISAHIHEDGASRPP